MCGTVREDSGRQAPGWTDDTRVVLPRRRLEPVPCAVGAGAGGGRGQLAAGWGAAGGGSPGALTGRGVEMAAKLDYAEVAKHNTKEDAWVIVDNTVYDLTSFAPSHPGGAKYIHKYAGKVATEEFLSKCVHCCCSPSLLPFPLWHAALRAPDRRALLLAATRSPSSPRPSRTAGRTSRLASSMPTR